MRPRNPNDEQFPDNKSRLKEKYIHIATAEARIWLFKQMLDRGIATRDVQAFIEKQAGLQLESKQVNMNTQKVAMRAKLEDSTRHLKTLHEEVGIIRSELLEDLNNKRHRLTKISKSLKQEANNRKDTLMKKFKKKIEHLSKVQNYISPDKKKRTIQTNELSEKGAIEQMNEQIIV